MSSDIIDSTIEGLRSQYPDLSFEKSNGTIVCLLDRFSYGVLEPDGSVNVQTLAQIRRMKVFLEKEPEMIRRGRAGQYAIILPDHSVMVTETEGSALNFADKFHGNNAFVGRIGGEVEPRADLMAVSGGLRQGEMPEDFETLFPETEFPQEMSTRYIFNRRWICASLRLANERYRKTWFLVDTGAVACYLTEIHREGVACPALSTLCGEPMFESSDFLGQKVRFRRSEDEKSVNIRGTNLIGTSFLNQFLLIDDFLSRHLMLTKREDAPVDHL